MKIKIAKLSATLPLTLVLQGIIVGQAVAAEVAGTVATETTTTTDTLKKEEEKSVAAITAVNSPAFQRGEKIVFKNRLYGLKRTAPNTTSNIYYAPQNAAARIIDIDSTNGTLKLSFSKNAYSHFKSSSNRFLPFTLPSSEGQYSNYNRVWCIDTSIGCTPPTPQIIDGDQKYDVIDPANSYSVPLTTLASYEYSKRGFSTGALFVPFKFHTNDRSLTTGGSLAGYLGYHSENVAGSILPFISAGLSWVDESSLSSISATSATTTTPTSTTTTTTQTTSPTGAKVGWTVAWGILAHPSDSSNFNIGLVFGRDYVNDKYKYQGKPWMALEIGYAFSK